VIEDKVLRAVRLTLALVGDGVVTSPGDPRVIAEYLATTRQPTVDGFRSWWVERLASGPVE
jgi:hypothetical protein